MNRKLIFAGLFVFMMIYRADAQQVAKSDSLKESTLSISMDAKVQSLMKDMEGKCSRAGDSSSEATEVKPVVKARPKSTAEICRDNPRIRGFKIQVAIVKSNEDSNKVKTYFRSKFSDIKATVDASLRPDYKVLAGSYFTKESAASDLKRIKQYFKEARVVEYQIFCVEGK